MWTFDLRLSVFHLLPEGGQAVTGGQPRVKGVGRRRNGGRESERVERGDKRDRQWRGENNLLQSSTTAI